MAGGEAVCISLNLIHDDVSLQSHKSGSPHLHPSHFSTEESFPHTQGNQYLKKKAFQLNSRSVLNAFPGPHTVPNEDDMSAELV